MRQEMRPILLSNPTQSSKSSSARTTSPTSKFQLRPKLHTSLLSLKGKGRSFDVERGHQSPLPLDSAPLLSIATSTAMQTSSSSSVMTVAPTVSTSHSQQQQQQQQNFYSGSSEETTTANPIPTPSTSAKHPTNQPLN